MTQEKEERKTIADFIENWQFDCTLGIAVAELFNSQWIKETQISCLNNSINNINRVIILANKGRRKNPEPNAQIDPRDFAKENNLSGELTLAVSLICEFQSRYTLDLAHHTHLLNDAIGQILIEINGVQIDAE